MRVCLITHGLMALARSLCAAAVNLPVNSIIEREDFNQTQLLTDEDPHEFTFKELDPRYGADDRFRQPYFRFIILFSEKAGITEEFFHRHWKTVHADLTMNQTDVGFRIQRYNQFHQDQEHRDKIQPLLAAVNGAMQLAPYDGIAEFHTKDYAHFEQFILAVFNNPVETTDQQKFVDTTRPLHVMAGYDNLIFGRAIRALRSSGGADGILPGDHRLSYSI